MVTMTCQLSRNYGVVKADSLHSPQNDLCCSSYPLAVNGQIKSTVVCTFVKMQLSYQCLHRANIMHRSGRGAKP